LKMQTQGGRGRQLSRDGKQVYIWPDAPDANQCRVFLLSWAYCLSPSPCNWHVRPSCLVPTTLGPHSELPNTRNAILGSMARIERTCKKGRRPESQVAISTARLVKLCSMNMHDLLDRFCDRSEAVVIEVRSAILCQIGSF
jgi:hypothetical protein